jgi:hypothetical protein
MLLVLAKGYIICGENFIFSLTCYCVQLYIINQDISDANIEPMKKKKMLRKTQLNMYLIYTFQLWNGCNGGARAEMFVHICYQHVHLNFYVIPGWEGPVEIRWLQTLYEVVTNYENMQELLQSGLNLYFSMINAVIHITTNYVVGNLFRAILVQ